MRGPYPTHIIFVTSDSILKLQKRKKEKKTCANEKKVNLSTTPPAKKKSHTPLFFFFFFPPNDNNNYEVLKEKKNLFPLGDTTTDLIYTYIYKGVFIIKN